MIQNQVQKKNKLQYKVRGLQDFSLNNLQRSVNSQNSWREKVKPKSQLLQLINEGTNRQTPQISNVSQTTHLHPIENKDPFQQRTQSIKLMPLDLNSPNPLNPPKKSLKTTSKRKTKRNVTSQLLTEKAAKALDPFKNRQIHCKSILGTSQKLNQDKPKKHKGRLQSAFDQHFRQSSQNSRQGEEIQKFHSQREQGSLVESRQKGQSTSEQRKSEKSSNMQYQPNLSQPVLLKVRAIDEGPEDVNLETFQEQTKTAVLSPNRLHGAGGQSSSSRRKTFQQSDQSMSNRFSQRNQFGKIAYKVERTSSLPSISSPNENKLFIPVASQRGDTVMSPYHQMAPSMLSTISQPGPNQAKKQGIKSFDQTTRKNLFKMQQMQGGNSRSIKAFVAENQRMTSHEKQSSQKNNSQPMLLKNLQSRLDSRRQNGEGTKIRQSDQNQVNVARKQSFGMARRQSNKTLQLGSTLQKKASEITDRSNNNKLRSSIGQNDGVTKTQIDKIFENIEEQSGSRLLSKHQITDGQSSDFREQSNSEIGQPGQSLKQNQTIVKFLRQRVSFFESVTNLSKLKQFAQKVRLGVYAIGEHIYIQNVDLAHSIFVICQGTVELEYDPNLDEKRTEEKDMTYITTSPTTQTKTKQSDIVIVGDVFGDKEFNPHKTQSSFRTRSQTAKAISQTKVLEFLHSDIRILLQGAQSAENSEKLSFFREITAKTMLNSVLDVDNFARFLPILTSKTFKFGQEIVKQGSLPTKFYILAEGEVGVHSDILYAQFSRQPLGPQSWEVTRTQRTIRVNDDQQICNKGEVFGHSGLFDPTQANVSSFIALTETVNVFEVQVQEFLDLATDEDLARIMKWLKKKRQNERPEMHLSSCNPSHLIALFGVGVKNKEQKEAQMQGKATFHASHSNPVSSKASGLQSVKPGAHLVSGLNSQRLARLSVSKNAYMSTVNGKESSLPFQEDSRRSNGTRSSFSAAVNKFGGQQNIQGSSSVQHGKVRFGIQKRVSNPQQQPESMDVVVAKESQIIVERYAFEVIKIGRKRFKVVEMTDYYHLNDTKLKDSIHFVHQVPTIADQTPLQQQFMHQINSNSSPSGGQTSARNGLPQMDSARHLKLQTPINS